MILAHRGDSYHAPENTIEAGRLGYEAGADGWELDVRMTKDGRLVVLHDESLARTTDVAQRFDRDPRSGSAYPVAEFSFDEVMSLDAGGWFLEGGGGTRSAEGFGTFASLPETTLVGCRSGAIQVPSLRSALEFTADLDWLVNIEIKSDPLRRDSVVQALVDEVVRAGLITNVTVSSFDIESVRMVSTLEPRLATGWLLENPVDTDAREILAMAGADALHVAAESCSDTSEFLFGTDGGPLVPLLVYTVNDAGPSGLAVKLAEVGVTGFFTDDPASFRDRFILGLRSS